MRLCRGYRFGRRPLRAACTKLCARAAVASDDFFWSEVVPVRHGAIVTRSVQQLVAHPPGPSDRHLRRMRHHRRLLVVTRCCRGRAQAMMTALRLKSVVELAPAESQKQKYERTGESARWPQITHPHFGSALSLSSCGTYEAPHDFVLPIWHETEPNRRH